MGSSVPTLFRASLFLVFAATMSLFGSGCGVLAAATNPKTAWALNDPAPMNVVMRRADVAEETATQVERLLMATPLDDDAAWVAKTAPAADDAKTQAEELAKNEIYATTGTRVVRAELWAKTLHALAPAPTTTTLTSAEVSAPQPAPTPSGKNDGKGGKKKRSAKADPPAPPPPPPPAPAVPKHESLLAAVDASLGQKYAQVLAKRHEIDDARARVAAEKKALDETTNDAEKTAKKAHIDELEKSADDAGAEVKRLQKELVAAVGASAAKALPDVRDHFGIAFVNLRQAVDDAKIANGVASLRYPLAVPTILQGAEHMAQVYAADVIQEKTGKRPEMRGLQPGVNLEGGKVQITLNGLNPDDMGKLSVGDVTAETVKRVQAWVSRALGLLGELSTNAEVLDFEGEVLGAVVDGFTRAGWTAPAAPLLPEATPPPPPQAAPKAKGRA